MLVRSREDEGVERCRIDTHTMHIISACAGCSSNSSSCGSSSSSVVTSLLADAVERYYGGVADLEPLGERILDHRCAERECVGRM
jgi:hypothetical protein